MANHLSRKEDLKELRELFQKLDRNGDGKLSLLEIQDGSV
jgi:Ca2+-binding EF-hand superfamily protein